MVRSRVNSTATRWADEHILVIGILPFTPQKDGTSGPSSWKPVKDLVRFCMTQGSCDDPKVEIIDYCSDRFQPQAFVKMKKEENAKCVFERVAGNHWYGNVLQVWWLISPTQPGCNRPAKLLRYSSRREFPEALEKHTQIRDEKLICRGPSAQSCISPGPWTPRSTRSRRQSRNSKDFHLSRPTSQHSNMQNQVWHGQSSSSFQGCPPMNHPGGYMDSYGPNIHPEASFQQWPISNSVALQGGQVSAGPAQTLYPGPDPGQNNLILNQAPIQQWMALNSAMHTAPAYAVPGSMNVPHQMSIPIGMAPAYQPAVPYMASPILMQASYMSGYSNYIPPSSAEYSYPNQKPTQPDSGIISAMADLSVDRGSSSGSSGSNSGSSKGKESVTDKSYATSHSSISIQESQETKPEESRDVIGSVE